MLFPKKLSILLFESMVVVWILKYLASLPNHTSYRKFYFNEFVANILRDKMGMIIFDLRGCGGCQKPKTSYIGAHLGSMFGSSHSTSSAYQRFHQEMRSVMTLSLHSVSISRILEPSLQGLISSLVKSNFKIYPRQLTYKLFSKII